MKRSYTQAQRTRHSWQQMMRRRYNLKCHRYGYWGGRDITMCKRWRKFEDFLVDRGELYGELVNFYAT